MWDIHPVYGIPDSYSPSLMVPCCVFSVVATSSQRLKTALSLVYNNINTNNNDNNDNDDDNDDNLGGTRVPRVPRGAH